MPHVPEVTRWDIVWVALDPTIGSEQRGTRPALVISNDGFNAHFPVVAILPLTRAEGKRRNAYPFEVMLPRGSVSPQLTSIVMPHQIRTIAKARITRRMGRLMDAKLRREIEARLLEHLGVEPSASLD